MSTGRLTSQRVRELREFTELCRRSRVVALLVVSGAGIGALLATALVAAGSSMTRHNGAGSVRKVEPLAVGQVCRVEFDVATIESCGNAGFGDLRFNCAAVEAAVCPTTTAITLENIGHDVVTLESDSGTPGDVVVTSYLPLGPGATVTIVPHRLGDFIFDIDVEAKANSRQELRVVDIV